MTREVETQAIVADLLKAAKRKEAEARSPAPGFDAAVRLWGASCVRRLGYFLTDERSRRAVSVAVAFARGEATEEELGNAEDAAWRASSAMWNREGGAPWNVSGAAAAVCARSAIFAATKAAGWLAIAYACLSGKDQWLKGYAEAALCMDFELAEVELCALVGNGKGEPMTEPESSTVEEARVQFLALAADLRGVKARVEEITRQLEEAAHTAEPVATDIRGNALTVEGWVAQSARDLEDPLTEMVDNFFRIARAEHRPNIKEAVV